MFWNVASAQDEISMRKWYVHLHALVRGSISCKNVLCWQQCFFFTHAVLHIVTTRPQTHGSRTACDPRRCFVRPRYFLVFSKN